MDYILTTPECSSFASNFFSDRPLYIVNDEIETRSLLTSSILSLPGKSTITFCGTWQQLTVNISRILSDWAIKHPERGCGLYLAESINPSQHTETLNKSTISDLYRDNLRIFKISDNSFFIGHAKDDLPPDFLINKIMENEWDNSMPVPLGVALTGHGAEYCIQLGSSWLSTYKTIMLNKCIIPPARKIASVIFLNACSTLRLGDSSVPQSFSLAYNLFKYNTAVIGSFRNLHTSPLFANEFANSLLTGESLGKIVNRLNLSATASGTCLPPFQLLGDAAIVPNSLSENLKLQTYVLPPAPIDKIQSIVLEQKIKDVSWLDKAHISITRWIPKFNHISTIQKAYSQLILSANRIGRAIHACELIGLDATEIALIVEKVERDIHSYKTALLAELIKFIQQETWIQSAYAPLTRRNKSKEAFCRNCQGLSTWTQFQPFTSHLVPIHRLECDRCGTLQEQIGTKKVETKFDAIKIHLAHERIDLFLPPLSLSNLGAIFLHRMPNFCPIPWPKEGGKISIPYHMLNFRGRLTVVIATMSNRHIKLDYFTLFVKPE